MWTKLRNYLFASNDDPDEMRRRNVVRVLSIGLLALSSLGLVILIIFFSIFPERWQQQDNQLAVLSAVIAILASFGIYRLNKRSSRIASFLLLVLLVTVSTFSDSPEELANGRSLFIFTIPIAISSLIFAPASSFFFAVVNTVIVFALASQTTEPPNVTAIVGFFMLAFISWLSSRNLEQALKDLRIINAELDQRVADRTRELSASLDREAAQASQREAILNSIADGVVVFDNSRTAIVANPSLSKLMNIPQDEILGRKMEEMLDRSELSNTERTRVGESLRQPSVAPAFRINLGSKTMSINAAEVQSDTNTTLGTVAVFRDVTREAELDKMKDTFLAIVSHEMKTPLNAILGFAEMIKEAVYGPVNDNQGKAASRIMENSRRLLSIVSELLDQAQIQSGRMKISFEACKPEELLRSVEDTMSKIAADKGVSLTTTLDTALPPVLMGDAQRLQQIMINLTNNAIKFSGSGSEVRLSLSRHGESQWQIQVADTGEGIPQESLEYIFDTFRQVESAATRKHGGVGLGLAIVKQLVELMNGKINVNSQLQVGSTFTVTLPIMEP